MKADHVVMNTQTGAFECQHCGQTYKPAMPAPIPLVTAMASAFARLHRFCLPPSWVLDEPTALRHLTVGTEFVLYRTGERFKFIEKRLVKNKTVYVVQRHGEQGYTSLNHACYVRPFAA